MEGINFIPGTGTSFHVVCVKEELVDSDLEETVESSNNIQMILNYDNGEEEKVEDDKLMQDCDSRLEEDRDRRTCRREEQITDSSTHDNQASNQTSASPEIISADKAIASHDITQPVLPTQQIRKDLCDEDQDTTKNGEETSLTLEPESILGYSISIGTEESLQDRDEDTKSEEVTVLLEPEAILECEKMEEEEEEEKEEEEEEDDNKGGEEKDEGSSQSEESWTRTTILAESLLLEPETVLECGKVEETDGNLVGNCSKNEENSSVEPITMEQNFLIGLNGTENEEDEYETENLLEGCEEDGTFHQKAADRTLEDIFRICGNPKTKGFQCCKCGYSCRTARDLEKHVASHGNADAYVCGQCDYSTSRSSTFKRHMTGAHGGGLHCVLCDQSFDDVVSFNIHTRNDHPEAKQFHCSVCSYTCARSYDLKKHMRKHTGEKPHLCTVCDFRCSHLVTLKRHMRSHTGERPVCAVCVERNNSADGKSVAHDCEKPYACSMCVYTCSRACDLKRHMRVHNGVKQLSCTMCEYKCFDVWALKSHLRTHTGDKPYKCTVCSYCCTRSHDLKTHMRIHTGEKPYSCPVCDYSCSRSSDLRTHMRTHTGEKPFCCVICSYSCADSSNLKAHMRTHTDERPYKCKLCEFSGRWSSDLKTHMRSHV